MPYNNRLKPTPLPEMSLSLVSACDAAGRLMVRIGHTACKRMSDRMLPARSSQHISSSSSVSPLLVAPVGSTEAWMQPFLTWNRSDTLADSCPIVTACCILTKAAYPFLLHLLKRRATGLYVCCFLMSCYATLSSFFMTEKMKIAERRQSPTSTPHTIHRGRSPQIHAATAVR